MQCFAVICWTFRKLPNLSPPAGKGSLPDIAEGLPRNDRAPTRCPVGHPPEAHGKRPAGAADAH